MLVLISKQRTRKRTQKRPWVRLDVSPGTASPIYGDRPITAAGCAKSAPSCVEDLGTATHKILSSQQAHPEAHPEAHPGALRRLTREGFGEGRAPLTFSAPRAGVDAIPAATSAAMVSRCGASLLKERSLPERRTSRFPRPRESPGGRHKRSLGRTDIPGLWRPLHHSSRVR